MIGQMLAQFELLEEIGTGRMGTVYRARDTEHGTEVALKVLPSDLVSDPDCLDRFNRDAACLASLNRPEIVAPSQIEDFQGLRFITMKLVPGSSLDRTISGSKLSVAEVIELGITAAEALQAAHEAGISHRDLAPANLMLMPNGLLKVLDFGLAKLAEETKSAQPDDSAVGLVPRIVPYMSPEQARGQDVDARTDFFSIGAVLYEAATGQRCFRGDSSAAIFDEILNQDPVAPRKLDPQIPEALEQILLKALEKDRGLRYQGAADLHVDFKRLRRDLEPLQSVQERSGSGEKDHAIDSLVVLPFLNTSGDPGIEYFSEGITESIINNLSQLPGLAVVSRNTAFRYHAKMDDPGKIAEELGVRAVVTGRVTKQGDDLTVRAELVDADHDSQLWGAYYERTAEDVFAVEQDIVNEVSRHLGLKVTQADKARLAKRHTQNTEAYELYLHGRFYWNRRSVPGLERSITFFQKAIDKDPSYALAYSGMADAYHILGYYNAIPSQESWKGAKEAAQSALSIDPALAEAHTSMAAVTAAFEWDWSAARQEYERAMEINPNYATTHHWYAYCFLILNRFEDAIEAAQRARALDPMSLIFNTDLGWCYYYAGDFDRAIEQYKSALELDQDFVPALFSLAQAYVQTGSYFSGIGILKRFQGYSHLGELGYAHARAGQEMEAKTILGQMKSHAREKYIAPSQFAAVHSGLGDKDRAFALLEKAYEQRNPIVPYMRAEPWFGPLRDDPRYDDLVRRMNFPE